MDLNISVKDFFKQQLGIELFKIKDNLFVLNDKSFSGINIEKSKYEGLLLYYLEYKDELKRAEIVKLTREYNKKSFGNPVLLFIKYDKKISLALSERTNYKQEWRKGEKIGKVIILRNINVNANETHSAHKRILEQLKINENVSFKDVYNLWLQKFSIQTLNNNFYRELQEWFDFAKENVILPYRPEYLNEDEHIKNFLVRLLTRILFCWFIKEKHLIEPKLLEIADFNNKYKLTNDINDENFLNNNSYYRGILQNLFFNALNKKDKSAKNDFKWVKYWHEDFDISWLTKIPYLNGGIFDCLDEDNAKESIEDSVIKIPNYLFYGNGNQKGLNEILKSYYFTLEENTPFEEDIALDPEMLGLVFENLLAELDPNQEESTIKSIRKQTGSYYTPRKVIREMVNDTLFIYLKKHITQKQESHLYRLIYNDIAIEDSDLSERIVIAIDQFKMLDPACGSGAFPMGMLHRLVDILKKVDDKNEKWLSLKLKSVDPNNRAEFEKILKQHLGDYSRKLGIIRDSIYGIDIQPLAVQITKLRFFISLLIDQKTENKNDITPMPNIETKIICADSLKNPNLFSNSANNTIVELIEARRKYYQPNLSQEEKDIIADNIATALSNAFPLFAKDITGQTIDGQNKLLIKKWFMHGSLAAPFFNMDFFYPELKEHGGFDCVMGNPPYGGKKIGDDVRNLLAIESKDPYGAFIARFLPSTTDSPTDRTTPLKKGGVLAFIVSDTFMTIKSHLKLRKQMMSNYIHKMVRVHPDTFRATVNTAIIICERKSKQEFDTNHICQMVDMTNISIHEDYSRFTEILHQAEGVAFGTEKQSFSNAEYAIYYYPQQLINTNNNLPFFVTSPKLFTLMNDGNDADSKPKTKIKEIGGNQVQVQTICLNGKEIEIVKLENISEIKRGLDTGKNDEYLFQNIDAHGNYPNIKPFADKIVSTSELIELCNDVKIRKEIILNGFSINKTDKVGYYYCGKFIIPFDKGGASDVDTGFIPNYYVECDYFINWSNNSVYSLLERSKNNTAKANLRNPNFWFINGITYSARGAYSPSYRLNSCSVFDSNGSSIFPHNSSLDNSIQLLAFLSSKLLRYILKNFCGHTVASEVDELKKIPIETYYMTRKVILQYVESIIDKQKSNPRYDYASHEQIEIDKLVYEAYGLSPEDVEEVENWYVRRYPKLSKAQKQNLQKLGKSDDYLVLYGYKRAEQ
jgi:hypothetical protein